MTLPWAPPDGLEMLLIWLSPLGEVQTERPSGATLPYWMINDLGGPSDRITQRGQYSIHTFDSTEAGAQEQAMAMHRRICLLAGQFVYQQKVTLSSGQVVVADDVIIDDYPHKVQWTSTNTMTDPNGATIGIYRFVGTYTIPLRFVAAA